MKLSDLTFEHISTDESVSIVKYFVQMWEMVQNWLQKDVDSGSDWYDGDFCHTMVLKPFYIAATPPIPFP